MGEIGLLNWFSSRNTSVERVGYRSWLRPAFWRMVAAAPVPRPTATVCNPASSASGGMAQGGGFSLDQRWSIEKKLSRAD